MGAPAKIPGWLQSYFWDVRLRDLNLKNNRIFIIERLLNEGDQAALQWLFKTYSKREIKEIKEILLGILIRGTNRNKM